MHSPHRTLKPLTTDMLRALSSRAGVSVQRAVMKGVEVSESTFDEWLAVNGERRIAPRAISSRGGLSFSAMRS